MTFWERIGYTEYQHQQNTWKCKIPECKQTNGEQIGIIQHISKKNTKYCIQTQKKKE